jgi:hypothetical protein
VIPQNRHEQNVERLAAENGIEIEFLRKRNVRKEHPLKAVLANRADHAGLGAKAATQSRAAERIVHNAAAGAKEGEEGQTLNLPS